MARFERSLQNNCNVLELTVKGEQGELRVDNPLCPQWGHSLTLDANGESETFSFEMTPSYIFQARHLAQVLREGAPVRTSGQNGLANLIVMDAVYAAAGLSPR